jgi:hypothetical protein
MNPKLKGVVFNVQGNGLNVAVQFKLNVEQCSKFFGSEFKDNPAGVAAAIRTRPAPVNVKLKTPKAGSSKADVIITKEEYTNFKCKERIWARTNPTISNMALGQCTQEIKSRLEG